MSWILALSLFSADGTYVKTFSSEKECVAAMNQLIKKIDGDENVKGLACVPGDYALND